MEFMRELFLVLFSLLLILFIFEIVLHVQPLVLGQNFANIALSGYDTGEKGIYYYDSILEMNLMKPNLTTNIYYNGYKWLHETDERGFRNSKGIKKTDIVLSGDSFVYGHGLEKNETINHFIENLSDFKAYNIGRQGDSLFQQTYLLDKYVSELNPKFVIYFFFTNDIYDLNFYKNKTELEGFVETPIDEIYFVESDYIYVDDKKKSFEIYLFKIPKLIKFYSDSKKHYKLNDSLVGVNSLAWNYSIHSLEYINYLSKKENFELIIAPIVSFNPNEDYRNLNLKYYNELKKFSSENGLEFIDLRNITPEIDETLFLENDGHFNEKGSEKVTRIVVEKLNGN